MRGTARAPATVLLAIALASALAGCRRGRDAPPAPEVTLFATAGEAAAQVLAGAAARAGVARVRHVPSLAEADVAWFADPTEAVEAGPAIAPGAVPDPPDVDRAFRDPRRRFSPLAARARVLLVTPRAALPFPPRDLRDLADPRLEGRVAVPPLGVAPTATALAALAETYGDASLERFLALLARNRPQLASSEAEVRARIGRGEAVVGLVGTEEGAAGALSGAGLEVVFPDQRGRGAVVLPTAVAVTTRARDGAAARALAELLASAETERLLVARVPGFMPLRGEVPVPAGVRPASNVVALRLDWDRLTAAKARVAERLRRWPGS